MRDQSARPIGGSSEDGGGASAPTAARPPGKSGTAQRIARRASGVAGDPESAVASVASSNGTGLPETARARFESSLGTDLSGVRVHTGAASSDAAAQLGARAFTTGNDIHFGAGQYRPDDPFGMHLLAHEVAHTVQQQGATAAPQAKLEVSEPGDASEHEADHAADAMVRGERATVSPAPAGAARMIHRFADGDAPAPAPTGDTGDLDPDAMGSPEGSGEDGPFEFQQSGGGGPVVEEGAAPAAAGEGDATAAAPEDLGDVGGGGGGEAGTPGEAGETEYMKAKGKGDAGGDKGEAAPGTGGDGAAGEATATGAAPGAGAGAGAGASGGSDKAGAADKNAAPDSAANAAFDALGAGGGGGGDPDAGKTTIDVPAPMPARGGGGEDHEASADAIADRAVRGESASSLVRATAGSVPGGAVQRQADPGAAFLSSGWSDVNEPGIVQQETGANLRAAPDKNAAATLLPQNTKVFILKHNATARWYAVTTATGQLGYIADWLLFRHVPEPGADIYLIKAGDTPIDIARRRYGKDFTRWGQDLRFVVNALVYVNNRVKHNGTGAPGLVKPGGVTESWISSAAKADVYIWLPSVNYINMIYEEVRTKGGGTGSISYDLFAKVAGALGEWTVIPSYVGGLVHGFVSCIADTVKGLFDLVKSIFSGEIISQLEQVWDALKKLTFADLKQALGDWWQSWEPRLLSDNPFVRGHAWGYLAGYLIGEIALFALGGAALNALKATKIATRLGQVVAKVLPRVVAGIEKVKQMGGALAKTIAEAKDAALRRFGKTVAPVVAPVAAPVATALRKVSSAMREKILWGTLRQPGSKGIIGGHFRGIIGHPNYAVEIVGESVTNPGCVRIKFIKKLPDGSLSNIKSPASTLFPKRWSKSDIIEAIEKIANDPAAWAAKTVQSGNGASLLRGTVKGVKIEVVVDTAGQIIAGYPL